MAAWNPGEVILGDYLIEKKLGHGGMGEVCLVKSQSTGRQFAVKRALVKNEISRKLFLAELQNWIDLPEHPNIVPCRFFRTVGDEIVIFADYIEGGSLAAWIAQRKLTTLEQILDVAIQFAWGLHAIHERGLIHQDVKPGNVLMTHDGVPIVTDFGLARARFQAANGAFVSPVLSPEQHSVLVPGAGFMTLEYASPEQGAGQPLSLKTDIWSWGVSVLDMFMGGVSCPRSGHIAAEVLESFLENGQMEAGLPEMPGVVAGLLAQCFVHDPAARVVELDLIAETLIGYLEYSMGRKYERKPPQVGSAPMHHVQHERKYEDVSWDNPREWLRKALTIVGGDPAAADTYRPAAAFSRKGAGVADLAVYEEAERLYKRVIEKGNTNALEPLSDLYEDKAVLCDSLDDIEGSLQAHDNCIAIRRQLMEQDGRLDLANELAAAFMNKAITARRVGDLKSAIALYDQCIAIRRRLVDQESRSDLEDSLAMALLNKAVVFADMGDLKGAVVLYDQCITIRRRLFEKDGRDDLTDGLAIALMNKANAIQKMGDPKGAVALLDLCVTMYTWLVDQKKRFDLRGRLAQSVMNQAIVLGMLGDLHTSIGLFNRCIPIWRQLVEQETIREYEDNLALSLMNKVIALQKLGDLKSAIESNDDCISIWLRLMEQEGRYDLSDNLAQSFMIKANIVWEMGDMLQAVQLYDRCISLRKRLVQVEDRKELAGDLAWSQLNRARLLGVMGNLTSAEVVIAKEAFALLREEVQHTGRSDLRDVLNWARKDLASILK